MKLLEELKLLTAAGRNKKQSARPRQTLSASKLAAFKFGKERKRGIKASPLPPPSTLAAATTSKPRRAMLLRLSARARSLVGELLSAVAAALLLAAQVASLATTFYVSTLRMLLDLPVALATTALRSATATAADAATSAASTARRVALEPLVASRPARALMDAASDARERFLGLAPVSSLVRRSRRVASLVSSSSSSFALPFKRKETRGRRPRCVYYECLLHHRRLRPAHHEFEYGVRMALLDLDAPPPWFASKEKKRKEHLSAPEARAAAGLPPSSVGPVWLLTMPPAAGYSQNPISVYYCYPEAKRGEREDGDLPPSRRPLACVAEVTNTPWGSVARFSFDPRGDSVPKCLHVSPFMDMTNEWRLTAPGPGNRLALSVAVLHPTLGAFFSASLVGRVDSDPRTKGSLAERSGSLKALVKYGYGPQRVAAWIYAHAAVLSLRKKLEVFGPPPTGAGERAAREAAANAPLEKKLSSGLRRGGPGGERWHEWVAAREWPWRAAANGV